MPEKLNNLFACSNSCIIIREGYLFCIVYRGIPLNFKFAVSLQQFVLHSTNVECSFLVNWL